jgi:stage II sporulation protein D
MRRNPAKVLIYLLIFGILGMFIIYVNNNSVHPLELMEPVEPLEPFDESSTPQVELTQIHAERTLNVAVDGKIVKMGLEEYVYNVLSAEMPASFSPEALKAQAVAARTFAVHKIMFGGCTKYRGADVCDQSNNCQAYCSDAERKSKWKDNYDAYSAKLKLAVSETAGKIITYDDKPILVLYHASSAGYTENVENVYSQALPYLRSVASPDEKVTNLESKEEYDRKWFCNTVNKAYPKAKLTTGSLEKQISITSRFASGRVDIIKLGGASITGVEFRRLVDIRSANFSLSFNKYSVIVTTEGFGHGVGMSQNGAQAMALEGSDYADILTYYYTGVKIVDMQ